MAKHTDAEMKAIIAEEKAKQKPVRKPGKFIWNNSKAQAAKGLAMGWPMEKILNHAKCEESQIVHWKSKPEFKKKVEAMREDILERVTHQGIVHQTLRLASYNKDWEATEKILEERGVDLNKSVPGGSTGYITLDYKGADGHEVAMFDAPLFRERRLLREQVARELGEFADKSGISSPPTSITICYVDGNTQIGAEQDKAIDASFSSEDDSASKQ